MRWLAKAGLQKAMSALPRAELVNYLFQRHVTHSLPATQDAFAQKLKRAVAHLDAYEQYGPPRPLGEARFYEFGAGWDLAVQLCYWSLGVERQTVVDLRPNLRFELVDDTVAHLRRLEGEPSAAGRALRDPGPASVSSPRDLEERFGIVYVAPRDASRTGLDSGSVDFITSTNTLEHIPADDIVPILAECRRLLRPDGAVSCRIDLRDHFAYFDKGLTYYNFLRFSDRRWRLVNSDLLHQNRLRRPDYLRAFAAAGLAVVAEQAARPEPAGLEALKRQPVAERFRDYGLDDLSVQSLALVARPSPDTAKEREHVGG